MAALLLLLVLVLVLVLVQAVETPRAHEAALGRVSASELGKATLLKRQLAGMRTATLPERLADDSDPAPLASGASQSPELRLLAVDLPKIVSTPRHLRDFAAPHPARLPPPE